MKPGREACKKKDNVMQQEPQGFAIMHTVGIMRREKQHIQTGLRARNFFSGIIKKNTT